VEEKRCAKCSLPFECLAPSPECWCKTIKPFQPVCEQSVMRYGGCICKACSSQMFYHPNHLRSEWGL